MPKHFIQKNIYGILGTIIFHMVLVIIFFVVKISDLRTDQEASIFIDYDDTEKELQKKVEIEKKAVEELRDYLNNYYPEEVRKNIAVNMAENDPFIKEGEELHRKALELQQNVSTQLSESVEQLSPDDEENINLEKQEKKIENKQEEYHGPTNVTYSLKNRNKIYLPIPVYKCEGSGNVVVAILVDQQGRVESVTISTAASDTENECFITAAKIYALKSRFNADAKASVHQEGTITYHFVAQ